MPAFCSAFGCSNTSNKKLSLEKKISYHGFPLQNKDLLKLWLLKLRRKNFTPNKYSKICSEHFNEEDFVYQPFTNRRSIKAGAVPSKFSFLVSTNVQKKKRISHEFNFPKDAGKRKLWETQLRRKNFKISDNSKMCSKHFTPKCSDSLKFGGTWLKSDVLPTIFNSSPHLQRKSVERKLESRSVENEINKNEPAHFISEKIKVHKYCRFFGCNNNSSTEGISLHRFPKEEQRCQEWVKACQNKALVGIPAARLNRGYVVCEDHFEDWCYTDGHTKRRLVHNAVPSSKKSRLKKLQTVFLDPIPTKLCRFNGCKNTSNDKGIKFFEFPKEEQRCQAWIEACQNKSLIDIIATDLHNRAHVCHKHFQDWCFMDIDKHTLVESAIPNCAKLQVTDGLISSESASVKTLPSPFSAPSKNRSHVIGEVFISPASAYEPSSVSELSPVNELNSSLSSTSNNHLQVIGELFISSPTAYDSSTLSEFCSTKVSSKSTNSVLAKNSGIAQSHYQRKAYIILTPTLVHSSEIFTVNNGYSDTSANIFSSPEDALIYPVSEEELNAISELEHSNLGTSSGSNSLDVPTIARTNCSTLKSCPAKELSPTKSILMQKVKKCRALIAKLELKLEAYDKNNSAAIS